MANRVLDAGDVATRPWATIGDILIDTANSTHADGKKMLNIQNGSSVFSTARLGANIWIDGSIGTFYLFRITNENAGGDNWAISDSSNYVHVKPVPGTRVYMERNASSNGGFTMIIFNIDFVVVDGETDDYPGLRDGWPNSPFLSGNFGIQISSGIRPIGGHQLSIDSPDGGHFIVRGVEISGGFSAIRYAGGNYDKTLHITLTRNYLRDAGDGEGLYLGATHAPPYVKLKIDGKDNIIARRAAESLQFQHCTSEDANSYYENFIAWCSAMDGIHAFQGGQSGVIQKVDARGGSIIRNGVIDGSSFTQNGLILFGSVDVTDADPTIPAMVDNVVFSGIGGTFCYVHNSNVEGVWRWMRNLYLVGFTNRFYYEGINDAENYFVSANNGTDRMTWSGIVHDGFKGSFFQNSTGHESIDITEDAGLASPQYVNTGMYEPASDHMIFHDIYAGYHDNTVITPGLETEVTYLEGWIVANVEQGVEHRLYRVQTTYTTSGLGALNPREEVAAASGRYVLLTWDEDGNRNVLGDGTANPAWASGDTQRYFPPDDFRLVADSYYNLKGMGLGHNPHNTNYTQYQWYRNDTGTPTGAVPIPGAKSRFYTPQDADLGKYLALAIKAKGASYDSEFRYSNWSLVS